MRVIQLWKPFEGSSWSTRWIASTGYGGRPTAVALFTLATGATATIAARDALCTWGYCIGVFLLACHCCWRVAVATDRLRFTAADLAVAAIAVWGFAQLAAGATDDRMVTWETALRMAALSATFLVASRLDAGLRGKFLRTLAWLGVA